MLESNHEIQGVPRGRRDLVVLAKVSYMGANILHRIDFVSAPDALVLEVWVEELMALVERFNGMDFQP